MIQIAETATMQARPQPTSHVHLVRVEDGFPVIARPAESNPEDRIPMATITHAIGAALESVGLRRPAKRLRDGGRCKDFLDQADAIADRGLGLVCTLKTVLPEGGYRACFRADNDRAKDVDFDVS